MPSLNIHRNDTVKVLTGSDRGKTGRVLRVFPDKGTVLVEHVRVVKKTVSSKQGQRTKGGIAEQESPIQVSNVMIVCPNCGPRRLQGRRHRQVADLQEVRAGLADEEVKRELSAFSSQLGYWRVKQMRQARARKN